MKTAKFPIILLTLGFASGIAVNHYFPLKLQHAFTITLIGITLTILAYRRANTHFIQKKYFGCSVLFMAFVCGILSHTLHSEQQYSSHYSHFIEKENGYITGTISERLKPNAYSEKYYFKVSHWNNKPATGKILLNVSKKDFPRQLEAGDQLQLLELPQPIAKSINPYQFNYAAYLEKQYIFHQVQLKATDFKIISQQNNFDYYIEKYRDKLLDSFKIHQFPEPVYTIIKALLLGQRQDLDAEINQQYTDSGVIHILAISGLHIAILYAILLTFLKPLSRLRNGKFIQLLIALGCLWGFALLSGLSASVVRSVVMFSFISWGVYRNQTNNMYNAMAVSMLTILFFKPNFLFDVGFQLSYAAVFSIVALQPLFRKYYFPRNRIRNKILNYGIDLVIISLIAQIGVLPISLYYFHQFPSLFLLANLVVIPLSSFILVYGIFILLMNFIWPTTAILLGKLLSGSIVLMNDYIAWITTFEGFTLKEIPFSFPLLVSLYLLIATMVFWCYQKNYKRLITAVFCGLLFQLTLLITIHENDNQNEFIVFNNKKKTLLAEKRNEKILVYTNDSLIENNNNLRAYNRGKFKQKLEIYPIQNVVYYKEKSILIVDSIGIYNLSRQPDIVLLTQSAKINLERLVATLRPKQIIADGSNYRKAITRWKATCEKEKIPFHATVEKGFYKIN
ncbi:ComEC/Rec2 family competence protein [Flavobacterium enshiense]|uniref:ComEC/Rec2 family competence protein n=1 Tax=Flavobacterium enshiense TaxID=1341165 RepID=UPI00345CDEFA